MRTRGTRGIPSPMLGLLAACEGWPALDHLSRDDTGGAPPEGVLVPEPPPLSWSEAGPRDDADDDTPGAAPVEILPDGMAFRVSGQLAGSGWDPSAVAARPACEGVASAFPTEPTGNYAADVDWRVFEVLEAGALCARFAPAGDDVRADLLAFDLDACGNPSRAWTDPSGWVVGFAPAGAVNTWATRVSPGRFAMVAAAYAPDEPALAVPYDWDVAALAAGTSPDRCEDVAW